MNSINAQSTISSTGILQYKDKALWVVVDYELGRYLRKLFWLFKNKTLKLEQPSNKEHITVVNDTVALNSVHWRKHEGTEVQFNIVLCEPGFNGNAYWLPVISQDLTAIRTELGLGPKKTPLHFGVGYLRQGKISKSS